MTQDTKPRLYYVGVIRGKTRVGLLAGPFASRDEAIAMIEPARRLACEIDPWCDFDAFGTLSLQTDAPGVLNDLLGLESHRPNDKNGKHY